MSFPHAAISISNPDDIDVNMDALGIMQYFAFDAALLVLSDNTPIKIPLLSIIVLYTSTTVYMASLIWNWRSVARIIREADEALFSETYDGDASLLALEKVVLRQSWMATIALRINIIIGDAVVWWCVCVIWRHRAIYVAGPVLLLLTLGITMLNIELMAGGSGIADTAVVLSLVTNLAATCLIAFKAFTHHRRLKKYLSIPGTKTRVLKVLALFIESGSVYCLILLVPFVHQFQSTTTSPLFEAEYYFITGCLVPLVAIYPTGIVFLTTLNWSPLYLGLSPLKEPSQGPPRSPCRRKSSSDLPSPFCDTARQYRIDTVGSGIV
ncbi:hypothetical protein V8D89_009831 [Ganoderma adspersum]